MYRKYIFIIVSLQKNCSSRDTIPLTILLINKVAAVAEVAMGEAAAVAVATAAVAAATEAEAAATVEAAVVEVATVVAVEEVCIFKKN